MKILDKIYYSFSPELRKIMDRNAELEAEFKSIDSKLEAVERDLSDKRFLLNDAIIADLEKIRELQSTKPLTCSSSDLI